MTIFFDLESLKKTHNPHSRTLAHGERAKPKFEFCSGEKN